MGWNRGLGRRTANRLTWNTETTPEPTTEEWYEKKKRKNRFAMARRAQRGKR